MRRQFDTYHPYERLLWKAIQGCVNFSKFCMPTMYWLSSTSLVSLCMNTWNFGPIQERKQNPKVLDMGWTLVPCLSFRDEFREESYKSSHIIVQEHINLSNSGVKRVVGCSVTHRIDNLSSSFLISVVQIWGKRNEKGSRAWRKAKGLLRKPPMRSGISFSSRQRAHCQCLGKPGSANI